MWLGRISSTSSTKQYLFFNNEEEATMTSSCKWAACSGRVFNDTGSLRDRQTDYRYGL